ncbi:hypothetical protein [Demequina sp. NBRC 110054]|uniref:hypothetical protein n=1 Tax=Demequina sp. NBRC 110054 TaxID=1570343 RepID=UPI001F362FF4|nr:hypothetical protein [Demequina sp. NBRC 110054]
MRCLRAAEEGSESFLEMDAARRVLRGPLLERCVRQHDVRVEGRRFRIDAFHAESATALEFDGEAFHTAPTQVANDRDRDGLLGTIGIQTVRFGYAAVRDHPDVCRARAEATIRSRLKGT